MISDILMNDIAVYIAGRIQQAETIVNGYSIATEIINIEVVANKLKIRTNTRDGNGTITDIRLKDEDGQVLISKPSTIVKDNNRGLVSTFFIEITENETINPMKNKAGDE